MKLKETNWSKIDEEEIHNIYYSIDSPINKAEMLLHFLKHKPTLELDYIEMFNEIENDLLSQHNTDIIEKIVDAYAQHLPNEFLNDFESLLNGLLAYYFFTNNIEAIEKHLSFIKKYPAQGVDLITIPLLWQLIYNGYYQHALELSKIVWKPLFNDEQIWGDAHTPFCVTIYLHELEQAYIKIQNKQEVSITEFYNKLNKQFEVDENEKGKKTIFYCLQNSFSKAEIDAHIQKKEYQQANLKMNIWFLVYMKQNFDVPFMLSDRWWNLLTPTKLYGTDKNDYWYVPYNVLDDHFSDQTDMMGLNQLELYGKVQSLEYAYHFIGEWGLISEESYKLMRENITALNYVYTEYNVADLWQMTFVFRWPQLYAHDPSIERIYRESFGNRDGKLIAFENNQQIIFNLLRPDLQAQIKEKNRELFDDFYNVEEYEDYKFEKNYCLSETFVRKEPKIRRNDPCPCGSGKKYKKCCLNN